MKKIIAMMLAILMLCASLAGCGEKKAETAPAEEKANVGTITLDVYKGGLVYTDMVMQQQYGISFGQYLDMDMGDGTTGADFIKKNAEELFREFESVKVLAEENDLGFTDEDFKKFEENKQAVIDQMGGEESFKEQLSASGMNEAFFDYMTYAQMVYQKAYENLFTGEGKYALTAESIVQKATDGGFIRVKHVLVKTAEDGSDVEAKKALATEIAAKATAGEDFDALIKEYGEDPGMESYPHGYIIDQNGYTTTGSNMVTEFTEGSKALEVGGVSAPVQTSYGFHVIKRFPIDVESVNADFEAFSNEFSQLVVSEVLTEYLEKTNPEFPEGYDSIDLHTVFPEAAPEASAGIEEGSVEAEVTDAATPEVTVEPATDAQSAEGGIEVGVAEPVAQ